MSATTWETSPERPPEPEPDPGSSRPEGERAWMPWTAPVALLSALMAGFVGGLVVTTIALAFGAEVGDGETPTGVVMAGTAVLDIALVATAVFFARMSGPVRPAHFGLRRTPLLAAIGWMIVAYLGFVVFFAVWAPLVGLEGESDQIDTLGVRDSDLALAFGLLLVCVAAPVAEEVFFRGFFFGALRNWRGLWPAALITGIIFGAIHIGSVDARALVPLAVFGVALCLLYDRTGSLYPPIALHAINNAVAFGTAIGWDWQLPLLVLGSVGLSFALTGLGSRALPRRAAVD